LTQPILSCQTNTVKLVRVTTITLATRGHMTGNCLAKDDGKIQA